MRNDTVVSLWSRGMSGQAGNLSSRDGMLYSYNLLIGYIENGKPHVYNYRSGGNYISQTTSCHVGLALRAGAILVEVD